MTTLSATVITYNEAANIRACLGSLGFCDEIVVVDSGSTDGTLDLAAEFTDRTSVIPFKGDGRQKNLAIGQASGDWIFSIDADEVVPPRLAEEIRTVIDQHGRETTPGEKSRPTAYAVPRRNHFGGVWVRHGGWFPDHQTRLWPKGNARWEETQAHSGVVTPGPVARLKHPLDHYTYDSEADYLERMERYAWAKAQDYHEAGRSSSALTPAFHQAWAFFSAYLLRAGFLDGRLGWRLAVLSSRYTRLKYSLLRSLSAGPAA